MVKCILIWYNLEKERWNVEKIPVILDCDNTMGVPGCDVDDGLTLLYLLGCPEVELLGITCSYGNNTQQTVYDNTLRLLRKWGREDIPVCRGGDSPAQRQSPASDFLAESARKYQGRLCILATGAMTNLLGAAECDPNFWHNVKTVSVMGGITEPLFVNGVPMDELNLSCDPEASCAVLTNVRDLRISTAQNSIRSFFARASWREMGLSEEDVGYWFDIHEIKWKLDGIVIWDVMAAVQLIHPELLDPNETVIGPDVELLRRGMILGCGYCRSARLPQIRDLETYTNHVYHTWRNAGIL